MGNGRRLSLALALFFLIPAAAFAQFPTVEDGIPFEVPAGETPRIWRAAPGGGMIVMPDGSVRTLAPPNFRLRKRRWSEPVWRVPQGKYGLELKDNLRLIGRPARGWTVTLKTGFGTVTIPLKQVAKLEPAGNGQFAAHLNNGDRVTGELVSRTLAFETDYGKLNVPSSELVRLSTSPPAVTTKPTAAVKQPARPTVPMPDVIGPAGFGGGTNPAGIPPDDARR